MADIKQYLDKIRAAVFGEEVRGSIIDAITAMNSESSQARNDANAAVEQAANSANASKTSEQKATQAAANSAKIDKMTVSANDLGEGANPTVSISDDGTKKHITFGIPRGEQGAKGNTGLTPNITATVTTGVAGSDASVSKSGTVDNPVLNFIIPRGETGPQGSKGNTGVTPNLTIGTVTTGAPGTGAAATITGTAEDPVLNLTIPEGQRGEVDGLPTSDEIGAVSFNAQTLTDAQKQQARSNISASEVQYLSLFIPADSWSGTTPPYSYTFSSPLIKEDTFCLFNFTDESVKKILVPISWITIFNKVVLSTAKKPTIDLVGHIALIQKNSPIANADMATIKRTISQGLGPQVYPVGTQFKVRHTVYGDIIFDVLAHNHHKKPGDPGAHTMTIGMHACINGRQIDNTEALYSCASELAAGTYHFKLLDGYDTEYGGGKNIQFTLTQSVPAGGVIMFPWARQKQSTETKVRTYPSRESTEAIETVGVSEGTDGMDLGVADGTSENMNHIHRARYGSNNWGESAARQWLNSTADANAWWRPQTIFDRPPSYANTPGFLAGFGEDFLAAVGPVDVTTARSMDYEAGNATGGSYETRDKFFLLSRTELGLGKNDQINEGSVLAYYDGATDVDRIKYNISKASTVNFWWLRSPYPWNSYNMRNVNPSGVPDRHGANSDDALAAACVIYGSTALLEANTALDKSSLTELGATENDPRIL